MAESSAIQEHQMIVALQSLKDEPFYYGPEQLHQKHQISESENLQGFNFYKEEILNNQNEKMYDFHTQQPNLNNQNEKMYDFHTQQQNFNNQNERIYDFHAQQQDFNYQNERMYDFYPQQQDFNNQNERMYDFHAQQYQYPSNTTHNLSQDINHRQGYHSTNERNYHMNGMSVYKQSFNLNSFNQRSNQIYPPVQSHESDYDSIKFYKNNSYGNNIHDYYSETDCSSTKITSNDNMSFLSGRNETIFSEKNIDYSVSNKNKFCPVDINDNFDYTKSKKYQSVTNNFNKNNEVSYQREYLPTNTQDEWDFHNQKQNPNSNHQFFDQQIYNQQSANKQLEYSYNV